MSFTEEMQSRGLDPRPAWSPPAPRRPARRSPRARAEPARRPCTSSGSALADGEPLLLEQVHLPAERFPGLLASDLEHGSLYDLLTERYDTPVARARESLEPVLLRAREARLLDSDPARLRCSSRASPSPPTAARSSSAGPTCAATAPATTSNGSSSGADRRGRSASPRSTPDPCTRWNGAGQ